MPKAKAIAKTQADTPAPSALSDHDVAFTKKIPGATRTDPTNSTLTATTETPAKLKTLTAAKPKKRPTIKGTQKSKLPDIISNIPIINGTQSFYRIISHIFNQIKRVKLPKETASMHMHQFSVMVCILKIEAESGIATANELCHVLGLEKWSVSIIIKALEAKGLIKRGYIRGLTAGPPTRSIYIQLPKGIAQLYYGKACYDPDLNA